MAGAVREVVGESALGHHAAGGVVHLGATHGRARRILPPEHIDGRIARIPDGAPHVERALGGLTEHAHPRLVGVDATGLPGPQVDQQDVARFDAARARGGGRVVRIGRMLPRGHDGGMIELEAGVGETIGDPLLELVLGHRGALARPLAGERERLTRGVGHPFGGAHVRVHLLARPAGEEARHEVRRRHDLGAGVAHHLQHAGGDAIDVRHRIPRRVLHRHALSLHVPGEQRLQRLPRAVALAWPGGRPVSPGALLDVVRDGDRHALARDECEHAPRDHAAEAEHAAGNRIGPLKVVEQPAIDAGLGNQFL